MRDFRLLLWLRWRQFQDDAIYWLRVLGYEAGEKSFLQQIYVLYLAIIGAIWVFAMWAWAVDSARNLGGLMPPEWLEDIAATVSGIVLVVQAYVLSRALGSTPLKLSFSDMSYIAATPIDRAAPVLFGWLRQMIFSTLAAGLVAALLAILLTSTTPEVRDGAALRAVLTAVPLAAFTVSLAWLGGLLHLLRHRRLPLMGMLPLLLIGLGFILPDLVLWPGRAVIDAAFDAQAWALIPGLLVVPAALTAGLLWVGTRIAMMRVADESLMHARIAALGLLAWRQLDLQLRIRLQSSAGGRRSWLRLPRTYGGWALASRAALSYLRHPLMLVFSVLWGAAMTQAALLIVVNNLPPQIWIGWVLVAGLAPPLGLLYVFKHDIQERFLRQFLPFDGFQLLMADILMPLTALITGAGLVLLLQDFSTWELFVALLLAGMSALLLALCGAVALTYTRTLQARLLATGATFGLMIVGAALAGLFGAMIAAGLAFLTLSGLLINNT